MTTDISTREPHYPTVSELGGRILDLRRLVDPNDKVWSATNPSIGKDPKGNYAVAIRSSNYVIAKSGELVVTTGGKIKAKAWFAELDKDFKCKNLRMIDVSNCGVPLDRGLEDMKLFWRDNHWQATAVMVETHTPRARMVICHLDKKATKVVEIEKFPGIDSRRPEKNWMLPYTKNPNFDFIYGTNATIKDGVLHTLMSDNPHISALRGNTNLHLLPDNTYLAIVHRVWADQTSVFNQSTFSPHYGNIKEYVHYFAQYDYHGRILALSKGFQFFQKGIEFAAGITENKTDFIVSYGANDTSSHIAFIPKATVMASLIPING